MIQEREQYGEIPRSNNPMDLLFLKHLHLLTMIMPDHSHITELLDVMHRKTQDLSFLIDQAHALTVWMKLATNWTTRLYQNGAEPVNFTTEQSSCIDHLLGCIESRDNGNSMRYHAANCCCIHCQGTHASEDHHLSISVPPLSIPGHTSLPLPLEQAQATTDHHRFSNYKKKAHFSLPSQHSAFTANAKPNHKPWPLPPRPTLPTMFRPSTAVTASSPSTRKSPISSTTNRMSGSPRPSPYHRTPPPPTNENEKRSSSFSKKNAPASGCSSASSRWRTTTPPRSTPSSRTRLLTQTSTGESSTGAQRRNGNNRCHRTNDALVAQPASHSNRPIGYNPRADESDYDDNETPDIADLYSDKVYNNID